MKKVLIVTGGFFPGIKYGGPPVSIDNFCSLMINDLQNYIVTLNHDLGEKKIYDGIKNGWNNRDNCNVMYLSDSDYKYRFFDQIVDELKPDYIYLQGLFQYCVFPCLKIAKKRNIKVILAPRGELCRGAINSSIFKKTKKEIYIYLLRILSLTKNVYFQSTSDEETQMIEKYFKCNEKKVFNIPNIPSIPSKIVEYSYKKKGVIKIIFLSRIHPKKNLLIALKILQLIKGNVVFDIYGPIEDQDYWNECLSIINKLDSNISVEYKGIVSHNEIHSIFSQYDLFLFPTQSENYGHVIIESLLSGTPVIISDNTPWNDLIEYGVGYSIPLSDTKSFVNSINEMVNLSHDELLGMRNKAKKYAIDKIDLLNLKKMYLSLFK